MNTHTHTGWVDLSVMVCDTEPPVLAKRILLFRLWFLLSGSGFMEVASRRFVNNAPAPPHLRHVRALRMRRTHARTYTLFASPESGTPFPPWQRALHRRCTPPPHTTVHVCARTRGIKRVQLPGIYIMMAHHLFTYESISLRCERKCEILCRRPACVCPRVCVR